MMSKTYKRKTWKEKQQEIKDLTSNMEKRITSYFESPENIKEYLDFMGRFHHYSLNNCLLIESQFMGAQAVGSFKFWKEKGYSVKKGEKGIKVRVPKKTTYFKRGDKEVQLKFATKVEKEKIKKKQIDTYSRTYFDIGHVFDVSQTNATVKDLPEIFPNRWLEGSVENYETMYLAFEKIARKNGIKIVEPYEELGVAKGVSYTFRKEVALNPRNSELQNVKTLAHELAHAVLHTSETHDKYSTQEKEFQAEMVAYTVSSYLGLDTSEYSLPYLNHWTEGKELKDQERLLKEVRDTSHSFIKILEDELVKGREIEMNKELINENMFGAVIYEHDNPKQQVLLLQDLTTNIQLEYEINKSLNITYEGQQFSLPNQLLSTQNAESLKEAIRNQENTSFILSKDELHNLQELKPKEVELNQHKQVFESEMKKPLHSINLSSFGEGEIREEDEVARLTFTNGITGKEFVTSVWSGDPLHKGNKPYYVYLNMPRQLDLENNNSYEEALANNLFDCELGDIIELDFNDEMGLSGYYQGIVSDFDFDIPVGKQKIDLQDIIVNEELSDILLKNEKGLLEKSDLVEFGKLVQGYDLGADYQFGKDVSKSFNDVLSRTNIHEKDELPYLKTTFKALNMELKEDFSKNKSLVKAEGLVNEREKIKNQEQLNVKDVEKVHWYEMTARPIGPGCQPKGFVEWKEEEGHHGIVAYERPLTEKELNEFEMKVWETDNMIIQEKQNKEINRE